MPRKLRPVIDGNWWLIGANPDLSSMIADDQQHLSDYYNGAQLEHNAPVDHHIVRDGNGTFHLWGCVRATARGRVLYHWQTDDLTRSPWEDTGGMIVADHGAGECMGEIDGNEWLQSPFFVQDNGTYYMFYGGHRAGVDVDGHPVPRPRQKDLPIERDTSLCQICLMTSSDGKNWVRHRDANGLSRVFAGPGETRDPCVIKIGDTWHMYYAGHYDATHPEMGAAFVLRTSADLINWSEWQTVHRDPQFGESRVQTECPFVIFKEGYYYLFRTVNYYRSLTYVFRSEDPTDFGIGDARSKLVGRIACAAPELYTFDGEEYMSSSHTPLMGEQMCRIRWIPE